MPTLTRPAPARPAVVTRATPFRRDARSLKNVPPIRSIPGKVRLVKDLLRVGRWPIGVDANGQVEFWTVTAETLAEIATVFALQKEAGQTRPLQWGHADISRGLVNVDADKVIDYVDSVFVEAGTLWGVFYVTLKDAATLTTVQRPVSVGVDHLGKVLTPGTDTMPMRGALIHVAIVDQAAMPGQGPFVQMAAPRTKRAAPSRNTRPVAPVPEPTRIERITRIRDGYRRRHG